MPTMITVGFTNHIEFDYVNYKGECEHRRVCVHRFGWGATEYHPQPQWIMWAYDMDRCAERGFAMRDMSNVREYSPLALSADSMPKHSATDARLSMMSRSEFNAVMLPELNATALRHGVEGVSPRDLDGLWLNYQLQRQTSMEKDNTE